MLIILLSIVAIWRNLNQVSIFMFIHLILNKLSWMFVCICQENYMPISWALQFCSSLHTRCDLSYFHFEEWQLTHTLSCRPLTVLLASCHTASDTKAIADVFRAIMGVDYFCLQKMILQSKVHKPLCKTILLLLQKNALTPRNDFPLASVFKCVYSTVTAAQADLWSHHSTTWIRPLQRWYGK